MAHKILSTVIGLPTELCWWFTLHLNNQGHSSLHCSVTCQNGPHAQAWVATRALMFLARDIWQLLARTATTQWIMHSQHAGHSEVRWRLPRSTPITHCMLSHRSVFRILWHASPFTVTPNVLTYITLPLMWHCALLSKRTLRPFLVLHCR